MQIDLFIEEWAGHGQLNVTTGVPPVKSTKSAQGVRTTGLWSRLFLLLGENISQPLPGPLETLKFVVKANQGAKGGEDWCFEWMVVRKGRCGNDEVEEGTGCSRVNDGASGSFAGGV